VDHHQQGKATGATQGCSGARGVPGSGHGSAVNRAGEADQGSGRSGRQRARGSLEEFRREVERPQEGESSRERG
ncbi:MAG: hypothetical protein ACK53Y_05060, partial [bacterium]